MGKIRLTDRSLERLRQAVDFDPLDLTGAVEAWFLDEVSGNIVGEVAGTVLTPLGTETYEVTPGSVYDPGISIPDYKGFRKNGATAALEPGTSDFNIFIVERVDTPNNSAQHASYLTSYHYTVPGIAITWGFTASVKRRYLNITSADGTFVTIQDVDTEISAAYNDGEVHTYEFQCDRDGDATVLLDGQARFSGSISALDGKNITSTGVGIGQDSRAGNRECGSTIFFVRQKHTLK